MSSIPNIKCERKLNIKIINIFANTKTLNVNNTKLFGLITLHILLCVQYSSCGFNNQHVWYVTVKICMSHCLTINNDISLTIWNQICASYHSNTHVQAKTSFITWERSALTTVVHQHDIRPYPIKFIDCLYRHATIRIIQHDEWLFNTTVICFHRKKVQL